MMAAFNVMAATKISAVSISHFPLDERVQMTHQMDCFSTSLQRFHCIFAWNKNISLLMLLFTSQEANAVQDVIQIIIENIASYTALGESLTAMVLSGVQGLKLS